MGVHGLLTSDFPGIHLLSASKMIPVEFERAISTEKSGVIRKTLKVSVFSKIESFSVLTSTHTTRVELVKIRVTKSGT